MEVQAIFQGQGVTVKRFHVCGSCALSLAGRARAGFSGIFCRYLTVGNHRLLCLDDNHYCGIFHDAVDGVSVGVHSLSLATFIVVNRAGPTNLVNVDFVHARYLEGVDFLLLVFVFSGGHESVAVRSTDANR